MIFERDIDKFIMNQFLDLLSSKDILLDLKKNEEDKEVLNASFTKRGAKWVKSVKKQDPFWDVDKFLVNVLKATAEYYDNNKENINLEELTNDTKTEQNTDNTILS
jgi:hypothetical protein